VRGFWGSRAEHRRPRAEVATLYGPVGTVDGLESASWPLAA
jgi:hypothetical protein